MFKDKVVIKSQSHEGNAPDAKDKHNDFTTGL